MLRIIDDWYERFIMDDWEGPNSARTIPTVHDMDSFCNELHQDIIKQITHGQGLYFGYEVVRHCENKIPIIKTKFVSPEVRVKKYNRYKQSKLKSGLYELMGIEETEKLMQRLKFYVSIKHNQKTL